jgi:hypothetical protein
VVIATACLAGCSLTLSGPEPTRPRDRPPECDSTKGFVASDIVLGSALALGGLVAIGQEAGGEAAIPLAAATAFYLAAARGNGVANDCRTAMAEYGTFLAERMGVDDDDEDGAPPPRAVGASAGAARARRPVPPMPGNPPPVAPPIRAREPERAREPDAAGNPIAAPPERAPAGEPAKPAKPAKPPPPPPAPADDPWSDFWQEAP